MHLIKSSSQSTSTRQPDVLFLKHTPIQETLFDMKMTEIDINEHKNCFPNMHWIDLMLICP